MSSTYSPH